MHMHQLRSFERQHARDKTCQDILAHGEKPLAKPCKKESDFQSTHDSCVFSKCTLTVLLNSQYQMVPGRDGKHIYRHTINV